MDVLSSMQLTEDMAGLDAQSKQLLGNREVLAVILGETVAEYKGYSREEIMGFIEPDSISDVREVSTGRTNTTVSGGSATVNASFYVFPNDNFSVILDSVRNCHEIKCIISDHV